ncbi:hypothetical protein [Agarivorans sp. 1_MG-2023]|uniref:hypothetical protein n=1 Tax=Agarivorans sp. 1_MG-2023 TaxID=3062634 RepID=UPI0034C60C6B
MFPQNGNFNNTAYKKLENDIRKALKAGDVVGPVNVVFKRVDPASSRPEALRIEYSVNGEIVIKTFKNEHGG